MASGSTVSVPWPSLAASTAYEWYATVSDGSRTTTGPTWRFTTGTTAPPVNLVGNGTFESNLTGWMKYGSATLTRRNEGRSGSYSVQIQASASVISSFGCDDNPNWVTTVASKGSVYRFSAWVKTPSGSRGRARLRIYELLGSVQQGSTTYSPEFALTSGWQLLQVDHTVRTAGTTLSMRVVDSPVAAGEVMLVDDVSITRQGGAAMASSAPADESATDETRDLEPEAIDVDRSLVFGASFAPNPAPREGTLTFTTTREGAVRVGLYDVSGRRVRAMMNEPLLGPGRHRLELRTDDASRGRLRSGLYFYRIEAAEGLLRGRVVLMN